MAFGAFSAKLLNSSVQHNYNKKGEVLLNMRVKPIRARVWA
jgi:hypothetical protein